MVGKKTNWQTKFLHFVSVWGARIVLATLAVAGGVHLLGGVDPVIAYPFAVVLVAYTLKETI